MRRDDASLDATVERRLRRPRFDNLFFATIGGALSFRSPRALTILALLLPLSLLAGCHGDRPSEVPPSAKFQKVSRKPLDFTAPADGTVYIVDNWDTSLLYSGSIRKGQTLSIAPESRKVMLDGQPVSV